MESSEILLKALLLVKERSGPGIRGLTDSLMTTLGSLLLILPKCSYIMVAEVSPGNKDDVYRAFLFLPLGPSRASQHHIVWVATIGQGSPLPFGPPHPPPLVTASSPRSLKWLALQPLQWGSELYGIPCLSLPSPWGQRA